MMHFVATIGRNDPCSCNSGKKYKRCCLLLHEAYAAEQRNAAEPRNAAETHAFADVARALEPLLAFDDDGFAELSNSAVDLANNGHFDQALAVCAKLLSDFPRSSTDSNAPPWSTPRWAITRSPPTSIGRPSTS